MILSYRFCMFAVLALAGCQSLPAQVFTPSQTSWVQSNIIAQESLEGSDFALLDDAKLVIVGDGDQASFVLGSDHAGLAQWYNEGDTVDGHLNSVYRTKKGDILVVGDYPSESTGVLQAFVMSLNVEGEVQWQTQYNSQEDMSIFAVDELSDQSFIFAGARYPLGSNEKFDALGDSFIMKTSTLGEVEWVQNFSLPQDDYVVDLVALPDNSMIALINNTDEVGQNLGMHLVRLDADGGEIFSKKIRLAGVIEGSSLTLDAARHRMWLTGAHEIHREGEFIDRSRSVVVALDYQGRVLQYIYNNDNAEGIAIDLVISENAEMHILGIGGDEDYREDTDIFYRHLDQKGQVIAEKVFGSDGVDIGHRLALLPDGRVVILATYDINHMPKLMLISMSE